MGEEHSEPLWHLLRGGKQYGPMSGPELRRLAELGRLRPDDLLWKPGFETWIAARLIRGLLTPPLAPTTAAVAGPSETEPRHDHHVKSSFEHDQQDGPAKPQDLRSLREHYDQYPATHDAASTLNNRPGTFHLLLSIYILGGLWAQDCTSMSVYWVARLPVFDAEPRRTRAWGNRMGLIFGVILVIVLALLLLGKT